MYVPFDLSRNVINFVLFSNSPCLEILSCLLFQLVDNVWVLCSCPVFFNHLFIFVPLFVLPLSFIPIAGLYIPISLSFILSNGICSKTLLYLQIYTSVCIQVLPFFGHHSLVGNHISLGIFGGYAQ